MPINWQDTIKNLSFSSRLETETAECRIMGHLIEAIDGIMECSSHTPRRIWTLHKVSGNQVRFYNSNLRTRTDDPKGMVRMIDEGLIGDALERDEDISIYPETSKTKYKKYVSGWDGCKCELIALIRDSQGKTIGVINIESDYKYDFFSKKNEQVEHESDYNNLLQITQVVSNILSLHFKNSIIDSLDKGSSSFLQALCHHNIDSLSALSDIIEMAYSWSKDRVKLLKSVFYITDINDNTYEPLAETHVTTLHSLYIV